MFENARKYLKGLFQKVAAPSPTFPQPDRKGLHPHQLAHFTLGEILPWPTKQSRADITVVRKQAERMLTGCLNYWNPQVAHNISAEMILSDAGLGIDIKIQKDPEYSGIKLVRHNIVNISFIKFDPLSQSTLDKQTDRVMYELEKNGFGFIDRDKAAAAFNMLLQTWNCEANFEKTTFEQPKVELGHDKK